MIPKAMLFCLLFFWLPISFWFASWIFDEVFMSEVTVYLASDLHPSEHVVLHPDYESVKFDFDAERLRADTAVAAAVDANDAVSIWKTKACEAAEREAALREELAERKRKHLRSCQIAIGKSQLSKERLMQLDFAAKHADSLQQRLTAAEQRNSVLTVELEIANINAAHWKGTIAGEGQVSKEARRYRGIRDVLPLNDLLDATKDCQSAAEWDAAVDAALKPTESGASE